MMKRCAWCGREILQHGIPGKSFPKRPLRKGELVTDGICVECLSHLQEEWDKHNDGSCLIHGTDHMAEWRGHRWCEKCADEALEELGYSPRVLRGEE